MTISPPPPARIDDAFNRLHRAAALTAPNDDGLITAIGQLAVRLRLELPYVRLLFFGHALGLLLEAVVISACSAQGDLFPMPSRLFIQDPDRFLTSLRRNFLDRIQADGGRYSEPLANYTVFLEWLQRRDAGIGINPSRARTAAVMAVDVCDVILRESLLPLSTDEAGRLRTFQDLAAGRAAPDAEAGLFPHRDPFLLPFLLGAAGAPTFLRAREAPLNPARQALIHGMDPTRVVMLRALPSEMTTGSQLARALDSTVSRLTQALVVEGVDPTTADGLVELVRRGPEPVTGPPAGSPEVLRDVDLSVKILHQWYTQNNDTLVLPDRRSEDPEGGNVFPLRAVDFPNALEWTVLGAGTDATATVKFNSRSALALTTDRDCGAALWVPKIAVAFSTIAMPSTNRLYAGGVTLMPLPAFGALLMLLFARSLDRVQVLQTDLQKDGRPSAFLIAAAEFSCFGDDVPQRVSFAPFFLDHTHFARINELRDTVSRMVRGDPDATPHLLSDAVPELLGDIFRTKRRIPEEFLEESDSWPWLGVDCAPASEVYECAPRLRIQAEARTAWMLAQPPKEKKKAKAERDQNWQIAFRELRAAVKRQLDRNGQRMDVRAVSMNYALSGRKAKAKLQRMGFLGIKDAMKEMQDLVRVVDEPGGSWYVEGIMVRAKETVDPVALARLRELEVVDWTRDFVDQEEAAARTRKEGQFDKADESGETESGCETAPSERPHREIVPMSRTMQRLRKRIRRAIVTHPLGVPLSVFLRKNPYLRRLERMHFDKMGLHDVVEVLLSMPDLVRLRAVEETVLADNSYMLYPTARAFELAERVDGAIIPSVTFDADGVPEAVDSPEFPPIPSYPPMASATARYCSCACHHSGPLHGPALPLRQTMSLTARCSVM